MEMQERNCYPPCIIKESNEDLLLKYLEEDDPEELRCLLEEGLVDINHVYTNMEKMYYDDKTALQIACAYLANEISVDCVKLLLEYEADVVWPEEEKNALHFAAEGNNPEILKVILHHFDKRNINYVECNVIFFLIKYIVDAEENEVDFIGTFKELLKTDIDINVPDKESGWTAIYLAALYEFKHIIKLLIEHRHTDITTSMDINSRYNTDLNLDDFKDRKGKSARNLIEEKNLFDGILPAFREENSNITIYTLRKNLRERKIADFKINYDNFKNCITPDEQCFLLYLAVERCLKEAVKYLLDEGATFDNNLVKDIENPLELASRKGFYEIIKLLLMKKPKSELVSKSLLKLAKSSYIQENNENVSYKKSLQYLLKYENLDINHKDYNENTALHYAIRYQTPEVSLQMLNKGASLACKDSFNKLAVADMDSMTLETHLNECIQYENKELSAGDKDARLIINLTSLMPPRNKCEETPSEITKINMETDTEVVKPSELQSETEVLQYMCTSPELRHLLKHPVILAFLFLKWYRIRAFFLVNLVVYIMFIVSLFTYIAVDYNNKSEAQNGLISMLSYFVLFFTFIILVFRELFQLIIFKHRYFYTFENWLELVLLATVGALLFPNSNETIIRQLSAIAIVASAIELLLLVGQLPSMSTHIMMLRTVSYTFFKLLLWYSILLIAFAYSFYTLFQETDNDENNNKNTTSNEDEEQDFFEDPGMSLLKTIVMLTGEFDAASIKFNTYPVISHLLFVMFVFLIAIVLFNLLNGLAVSDTQVIKNDAELFGQILRVEHIAHVERILLPNKFLNWIPKIQQICIFPSYIKENKILVYPNQNSKVIILIDKQDEDDDVETRSHCYKVFFETYLDKKIQRAIRALMKERKEDEMKKNKEEQMQEDINQLRKMVEKLIKNKNL